MVTTNAMPSDMPTERAIAVGDAGLGGLDVGDEEGGQRRVPEGGRRVDRLDREALRRGLAAGLARWKVDGRWLREAFVTPDPGPEVMHVRDRLVDQGCSLFSKRIERDARAGLTVGGPPDVLAKMVVHLRSAMFADVYTNPDAYDEDELLDTLTDAILRLLYGATPDHVER